MFSLILLAALSGSHQVLQNQEIDNLRLPRIENESQLNQLIRQGELVKINQTKSLKLSENLSENRTYCRYWVSRFLRDMSDNLYNNIGVPLIVDSLVRTAEQQTKLVRVNKYAAPAYGEVPSSHLAGTTVDIAKRRYSRKQRKWIINYLRNLQDQGYVIVSEEPFCYHVFVREIYNEVDNNEISIRVTVSVSPIGG